MLNAIGAHPNDKISADFSRVASDGVECSVLISHVCLDFDCYCFLGSSPGSSLLLFESLAAVCHLFFRLLACALPAGASVRCCPIAMIAFEQPFVLLFGVGGYIFGGVVIPDLHSFHSVLPIASFATFSDLPLQSLRSGGYLRLRSSHSRQVCLQAVQYASKGRGLRPFGCVSVVCKPDGLVVCLKVVDRCGHIIAEIHTEGFEELCVPLPISLVRLCSLRWKIVVDIVTECALERERFSLLLSSLSVMVDKICSFSICLSNC